MRMRAVLAAALVAAGAGLVSAQVGSRSQATFRSEVNYVEVDVIVTDAQGNVVPGLTAADFEIREAGKPQVIEAFHEISVPIAREDRPVIGGPSIAPDTATNEGAGDGRLFVIVLDDFHVPAHKSNPVRRSAHEFVNRYLGSNDLAAVVHVSRPGSGQDFTANRALLAEAIDSFVGSALPGSVLNRMQDL